MIKSQIKPWVVLGVTLLLIAAGWYRGEIRTVITKATAICVECIRIG